MNRTILATAAAAVVGLFFSSCETYDPNNPNDPFNRQLDATYGRPAPAYGTPPPAPGNQAGYGNPAAPSYQAPPMPQPQAPPSSAPAQGDIGRLLQLTNLERSGNGAGSVRPDARLTRAAQNHSQYLAATRVLSHVGPSGERAGTRMTGQGYIWRAFAENIVKADTAEKAITQWMNSPPHRANLLNPIYTDVGIGYANGYWTIVFGRHK